MDNREVAAVLLFAAFVFWGLTRREVRMHVPVLAATDLVKYAGAEGEDSQGRRLDRREFEATRRASDWLATCQSGQYGNLGRYREDMLGIVEDSPSLPGACR